MKQYNEGAKPPYKHLMNKTMRRKIDTSKDIKIATWVTVVCVVLMMILYW